jgi:opacity protein-like surface antigen
MKILNKVAIALIALSSTTTLSSEGLYAGIGFGLSNLQADKSKDSHDNISYFINSGSNGTVTGTFLGYNHLLTGSPLFIGLEGGAQIHNLKTHLNQSHDGDALEKADAKIDHSFSGVFKFGIVINELMVYGKAGITKAMTRLNYFSDCHNIEPFNEIKKTYAYGSIYGFGMDFKVNPNWKIGVDHAISTYNHIDVDLPNGTARVDPIVSTTSLRLTYVF